MHAKADQEIKEALRFEVGSVPPEINGVDMDGVPFKLSDYRGKVVLLDFWGFW
jgi:cytochrome oxidase Cu insertion factor (SCO1/SenC/PrrC family)